MFIVVWFTDAVATMPMQCLSVDGGRRLYGGHFHWLRQIPAMMTNITTITSDVRDSYLHCHLWVLIFVRFISRWMKLLDKIIWKRDVFCNLAISVRVLCSVMVWWTASLCGFVFTMWCFCRRWYLLMQFCLCTCSFVLAFSLRFNGHFQAEPGLAGVYWSKGWWKWWWQIEL